MIGVFAGILIFLYIPAADAQSPAEINQWILEGRCAEAIPAIEQELKGFLPQDDSKEKADVLHQAGVCYNMLARYSEAVQALTQAEKIHSGLNDEVSRAFDLVERAATERLRANYNNSLALSQQVLEIASKIGNRKCEADAMREIGAVHVARGEYVEALKFTEPSLNIAREINDQRGIGLSLKDEGAIHFRQGEYDDALKSLEQARKIAEDIHDRKLQAQILSNSALVYGEQGDLNRELENYEQAGKIAEEIQDRSQLCLILLNCGTVYFNQSEFRKSHDYFYRALTLAREIDNKRFISGGLSGLGFVELESGNNDTGLDYLRQSAALAEQIGDKNVLSYDLNELGYRSMDNGDFLSALKYFQRGLQLRIEMNDKRGIAFSYNYMGYAYMKNGDFDRALDSYQKSLAVSEPLGIKQPLAGSYNDIATIYYQKKEMATAQQAISKTIELSRDDGDRDTLSDALHTQGLILRDTGKTTEALASFREAIGVIESVRAGLELPEEKAGFLEGRRQEYEDMIALLLKEKQIPEAFDYAQKSKARAFLDMLAEMRIDPETNLPPDLLQRREKLFTEIQDIQSAIQEEADKPDASKTRRAELQKKQNGLEEQYSILIRDIRDQSPRLADMQYPQPKKLAEAQASLDPDTVLLEYFVGNSNSTVFAVTHDHAAAFEIPDDDNLSKSVTEVRNVLQKPDLASQITENSSSRYLRAAASLYSKLLQPAQSLLQGKRRIIIAPDGPLHYLPFEALLTKEVRIQHPDFATLPYLTLRHEIQYVPSISVLASLERNRQEQAAGAGRKELLAFADPALPSGEAQSNGASLVREWVGAMTELPYTKTEVEEIAHLFPEGTTSVFTGGQATERNLKNLNLESYRRLHFASHGLIDEEKPQFSALVLTPDPKSKEDGFLTMREVFELKLNADLVVLSACKTGLGKRIRGEGVAGLSRAFLSAGASSVLVSLWNVYDISTANFMQSFYRNMEQGKMTKVVALQKARQQMIQSGKYSHPYYWAPFVLIGNN